MSLKNILALTMLICFSTNYYTIKGEIILGVEIPKLNITEVCLELRFIFIIIL